MILLVLLAGLLIYVTIWAAAQALVILLLFGLLWVLGILIAGTVVVGIVWGIIEAIRDGRR